MPEETVYALDRIANAQENPTQSIVCGLGSIVIKNNNVDYTLNLAGASDKAVIVLKPDNTLAFGILGQVIRAGLDNTGQTVVKTGVICQSDKISLQVGDVGYDLKLPAAEDGSVLVKKGNELILREPDNLRFKTVDPGGQTTINSSVSCKADMIVLQVGPITFNLVLNNVGSTGKPLIGKNSTLGFDFLAKLANVTTTTSGGQTTTIEHTSIECAEDQIKLKIGETTLGLKLENGEENSPIVKRGSNLIFGEPPSASNYSVVISDVLPTIDEATENTVYFIFDSTTPIIP